MHEYHPVAAFITPPEMLERIPYIRSNVDMHSRICKMNTPDDALPYDTSLWPWPLRERRPLDPPQAKNRPEGTG